MSLVTKKSLKYSLIVYYELITFPCINLMCLIYVFIHKLLLYVFDCQDSLCTVPVVI